MAVARSFPARHSPHMVVREGRIKLSTSSAGLSSSVEALPEVNVVRSASVVVDYAALATHQGACPLTQWTASLRSHLVEK
jgi:hypothetical protein